MSYVILAFLAALPFAYGWQARRSSAVASPDATPQLDLSNRLLLIAFTLGVVASAALAVYVYAPTFVDDAYISYRYAENLSSGAGLAWNPGEAPLEGYTNLLLVILMAPIMALGADPLLATRILSLLSVAAISVLIYRVALLELGIARSTAFILAIAYPVAGNAIPVAMIGLESSLYTYVIFQVFVLALSCGSEKNPRTFGWLGILGFVALLLRPGAVFVLAAIGISFVARGDLKTANGRRAIAWMTVCFAIPLGAYLLWKLAYFGTVIPNPAHIKMAAEGGYIRPLGLASVVDYLVEQRKLILLALVSLSIPARLPYYRLAAALLIAVYGLFYAGVDTLMDMNHRFMHPVTPFLYWLALPALARITNYLLCWREQMLIKLPAASIVLFGLLFFYVEGPVSYLRMAFQTGPLDPGAEGILMQVGSELADFEDSDKLVIMSQDAGLVPYLTRARHLDTAGLTDPVVARGGSPAELVDYLFGEEPTLVIQRGRKDGQLLSYAHGPLGDQRQWIAHPGWDAYSHVGSLDQPGQHNLHFFVRVDDARHDALTAHLKERLIENSPAETPLLVGTLRTE